MRVVFVTSEIMPYSKTGGLADVSQGLTKALRNHVDLVCITPLYESIDKTDLTFTEIEFDLFGDHYRIFRDGYIYFIEADFLDRMYGYEDDELRFIKFSHAVLALLERLGSFDLVHLNDWQTALIAFLLKKKKYEGDAVLTIHNLSYQGIADKNLIDVFGLGWENFTFDKLEYYDKVNMLKAGIVFSDKFNTVSPSYAEEIQTPTFSEGLGDVICEYRYKLKGILNGMDYEVFNPETDRSVIVNYTPETIFRKKKNKEIVLKYAQLKDVNRPLFAFVGRFAHQKGIKVLVDNANFFSHLGINFIMLGSGELTHLALPLNRYDNIAVFEGYNESLARMIYAGCDFFVMPSFFEPCGLSQMISAAYGAVPIVSSVGGLIDTVDEQNQDKIFGYRFFAGHYDQFKEKIKRAVELYKNRNDYTELAARNMRVRFSWDRSAREYLDFYRKHFEKPKREKVEVKEPKHEIPKFYHENRVRVMNVNPELCYIYWNIKPEIFEEYKDLYVIVIDGDYIVFKHNIKEPYGEYFLKYKNENMRRLFATVGIFRDNKFVDVLREKSIKADVVIKAVIAESPSERVLHYGY